MRLHRACAAAALRAGDRPRAAYHLAQAAELVNRGPGLMPEPVPPDRAARWIAAAAALAGGDPAAQARVVIAAGFDGARLDAVSAELAERGITLARRAGDPLGESAALDLQTSIQVAYGDIAAAAASALRRTELLAPLRRQALGCGLELFDAYQMAAETSVAAGDLAAARELAEQVRDLPFYREEGHLATARLLVVTALAGDWDETTAFGERFREGWERAGRPRAGNLNRGTYAAAAVCGLRGDDAGRAEWLTVVDELVTPGRPLADVHHGEFFDALVLLHSGRPADAMTLLATPPEDFRAWYNGLWRPWYAALWAEAAVLAGDPAAVGRIGRAPVRRRQPDRPGHRGPFGRIGGRLPGRDARRGGAAQCSGLPVPVGPHARPGRRPGAGPGRGRAGGDGRRPDGTGVTTGGGLTAVQAQNVQAQNRVGGPAGTGSGSGSTSGTRARTASWKRRASSSATTLSGVWMNTVGERPSRSQPATVPSQGSHPATVRSASSRPM